MVGNSGSPDSIRSVVATNVDNLTKKRKLLDELPEMPLPKHACWDQTPVDCSLSSESSTHPNRIESGYSNSSACSIDFMMSADDEAKTNPGCQETHTSDDTSTSSLRWGATSSLDIELYSSESRSMTKLKSTESETESTAISEQPGCPYHQCALHSSQEHILKLEGFADCICSEYESNAIADTELEDLLYSNGVDPKNYVLSSGRWSVNQDARAGQGGEKLTIDKEFEQYFSMLML